MFDLIGLGECMVELYADQPLGSANTLQKAYGGDVLNSLVTAQRLGSRTAFISKVGNDPFGHGLRKAWQAEGIDVSQAPMVNGENGVYFISLLEQGEREFTYRRANSAASMLSPADIDPNFVAKSRVILLSGITQAISVSAQAATLEAARIAKENGVLVAYDPNYRPKLWAARSDRASARNAFLELVPYLDILLPSFPADADLLNAGQTSENAARFFAQYAPLVALKNGADGVVIFDNQLEVINTQAVEVRDSTGAGDAWNGAFLHALHNKKPSVAAREANRVAAQKLLFRGAIPPRVSLEVS
jgi:2-dehydro-3-deoxygluconokinase